MNFLVRRRHAGRTALLRLLPFSLSERAKTGAGAEIDDILDRRHLRRGIPTVRERLRGVLPLGELNTMLESLDAHAH